MGAIRNAGGRPGGRPADTSKAPTRLDLPSHDQREHRPSLYLLLLFLVLAASIVATGYFFYGRFEQNFRAAVELQLSSIAELKVDQLVQWRKERMGDASVFYKNKAFSGLVRRFLEKPADAEARGLILNWLGRVQGAYQCDRIFILDAQGIEWLAVPEAPPAPVASHVLQQITEVLSSDKITFLDFHRDAPDRPIHLSLAIPVREESDGGQPLGVLVLRIDPATYLYPYISAWPIPSLTAETLLVRRDGNDALFLNELKFQKDTALKLRVPLTSMDVPAAKAVLGQEGIVEGIDYRGVPVLADIRGIPDSPWFLVARMDTVEVFAPLRARLWLMIGLVAVLICGAGAGVGMIWRLQRTRFYRERYKATEALLRAEEDFRHSLDDSPLGVRIVTAEGETIYANRAILDIYGFRSLEELRTTPVEKRYTAESYAQFQKRYERRRRGEDSPSEYEVSIVRKNGEVRHLQVSRKELFWSGKKQYQTLYRDITERKRSEEELRESEEKYRAIIETNQEWIWQINNKGIHTFSNPAIEQILGYSIEDIVGKNATIHMHPEDRREIEEMLPKWIENKKGWNNLVLRWMHKDGSIRWLESNAVVMLDVNGELIGFQGSDRDITERKLAELASLRAEEALRESEVRYRTLFDESLDGICLADAETGLIIDCNQALAALVGRERAELIGQSQTILHPPYNDQAATSPTFRQHLVHKEGHTLETQVVTSAGIIREVEIKANQLNLQGRKTLQGVFRDITERKRAAEAVRKSEEKYRGLTENVNLGIYRNTVGPEGKFIEANPAIVGMFGYKSKEEFLAINVLELYQHADGRNKFNDKMLKEGFVRGEELWLKKKDGSPFVGSVSAVAVKDEQGHVKYYDGIIDDITERKRAEEALRASLREKEVLLREVHHRVKNNMQVISSLFNLQAGHTTNEECRGILKEGQTRIRSMSLVHEKLYQSRDLSKIDFAGYIQSLAVHLLHVYLVNPAQVRMETDFEDVSLDINSAVPCGLILNELISNALKHAFSEGRTGVIKIGLRRGPGGAVELRVADDGVGFPKGLDFRKAESFGLQIVNLLVDQLEATIEIDRTKGTAFTVTFRKLKYALRT